MASTRIYGAFFRAKGNNVDRRPGTADAARHARIASSAGMRSRVSLGVLDCPIRPSRDAHPLGFIGAVGSLAKIQGRGGGALRALVSADGEMAIHRGATRRRSGYCLITLGRTCTHVCSCCPKTRTTPLPPRQCITLLLRQTLL